MISTHTPLARRDGRRQNCRAQYPDFYSHASCEARRNHERNKICDRNFYSHASCEARRKISLGVSAVSNFYSHASCEARQALNSSTESGSQFLLTRLLRGATRSDSTSRCSWKDFYSHAPCGARQLHIVYVTPTPPIYKRRTQKL